MITQWQTTSSQTAYRDLRFDFLKQVEDTRTLPYLDSKQKPTIAVGFNLRDSNVLQRVFEAMKIDIAVPGLTPAQQAAEQGYIDLLEAAIVLPYAPGQNNILRPNLDAVMFNRAHDPLLQGLAHIAGRNTFEMNTTEMRTAFDLLIPTYENKVSTWLAGIPESNERAALVSLAYNSRSGSTSLPGGKKNGDILHFLAA
ncbi:MAG: hypothetical protein ABL949_17150 [Fimbriimonadaceae bacterium]